MEIQTCIADRRLQHTLQSERGVENVSRVGADSCQRAIEVDRDSLHLRVRVGDEVRYIRRRRDAEIDVWVGRIKAPLRIVHHRPAPEDTSTLAEYGTVEIAGSAHERRIAESQSIDANDG